MTPEEARDFATYGRDALWRITKSGMYRVLIKDKALAELSGGDSSGTVKFYPNYAQRRFIKRLHYRNLILKPRRLGFTTVVCIMWLDYALFNQNVRCGIIAQGDDEATAFFRDKVKFAYDNLDDELKEMFPLDANSANELRFKHNNSSIKVATSFASGNLERLLISEYGKICAKNPDKASQIVLGTIPTVPMNGIIVIESTGEGNDGDYHDRAKQSQAVFESGRELTQKDYCFHFYSWWDDPDNVMSPDGIEIPDNVSEYLDEVQEKMGKVLSAEQKAWYAETLRSEFQNNQITMFSQYPSTPDEPFYVARDGGVFLPENIRIVDAAPAGLKLVRGWDFASSAAVPDNSGKVKAPDWTVGFLLGKDLSTERYCIVDVVRFQGKPDEVERTLVTTARNDGLNVQQDIPTDPGAAGKFAVTTFFKKLAGLRVVTSTESGDKVTRAEPFAAQVNIGNVDMVRAPWNDAWIREAKIFNGHKRNKDDQVDCASRAFARLQVVSDMQMVQVRGL